MSINANTLAAFCAAQSGTPLCPLIGAQNIVYLEGLNPDGSQNNDLPNRWNDLRLLLSFDGENWKITHSAIATTEPGDFYTQRPTNKQGCARIAFGYHPPAWKMGHHKGTQPALVQAGSLMIHRDFNRDGIRNRSETPFLSVPVGVNQHTTNQRFNGDKIGKYSAGCLVGKNYVEHLRFLDLLKQDVRIVQGTEYRYDTWVLPGNEYTQ